MTQTKINQSQIINDGWTPAQETWTYASASTFTVSGIDVTAKYNKGCRLRFKQGAGYKYAVVVSSAFSTNTTVTILVNTDFTIATPTAITDNDYSYQQSPQGYPHWFNIAAPTWSVSTLDNGSGGQPTTTTHRAKIDGNTLSGFILGSGVKAGTTWYIFYAPNYGVVPVANIAIGSANVGWGGNDKFSHIRFDGSNFYFIGDTTLTIADNQAISTISANFSFQF